MTDSVSIQVEFCANAATERSLGGPCVCALLDRCVDHFSADADARNDDDALNALIGLRHDHDEKTLCFPLAPLLVRSVVRLLIIVFSPKRSRRRWRRTLSAIGSAFQHHGILC